MLHEFSSCSDILNVSAEVLHVFYLCPGDFKMPKMFCDHTSHF